MFCCVLGPLALTWYLLVFCAVCVLHKTEKTGQVEDKRSSFRPKNLSTADKYYLKVVSLKIKKSSQDLTRDLRDASDPSVVQ